MNYTELLALGSSVLAVRREYRRMETAIIKDADLSESTPLTALRARVGQHLLKGKRRIPVPLDEPLDAIVSELTAGGVAVMVRNNTEQWTKCENARLAAQLRCDEMHDTGVAENSYQIGLCYETRGNCKRAAAQLGACLYFCETTLSGDTQVVSATCALKCHATYKQCRVPADTSHADCAKFQTEILIL